RHLSFTRRDLIVGGLAGEGVLALADRVELELVLARGASGRAEAHPEDRWLSVAYALLGDVSLGREDVLPLMAGLVHAFLHRFLQQGRVLRLVATARLGGRICGSRRIDGADESQARQLVDPQAGGDLDLGIAVRRGGGTLPLFHRSLRRREIALEGGIADDALDRVLRDLRTAGIPLLL